MEIPLVLSMSENVWKEIMGHVKLGGNMLKIYVITQ